MNGEKIMKKKTIGCFLALFLLPVAVSAVFAQDENPNGFPSGHHFNLNIIGKKAEFVCPAQEYDPITGAPVYGNVVFVPESGDGIQLFMQSGSTKGKAAAFTELKAVDPCAGFDGDGATVQLPPNPAGYRVYARALAKPTSDPTMKITPSLISAEDENGNDLVYLGLVTDSGFLRSDETLVRTKGKSKAVNVTPLFQWSGDVCYFAPLEGADNVESQKCVLDADGDGIYEGIMDPLLDDSNTPYCSEPGYTLITTYCTTYEEEWIFNIADFVTYLWSLNNDGTKLVQVRFYPN
ncbi:MAG: hypothetical protein H6Q07_2282 [Acidobacteria bacterium]|jgi:hypothetical protein|nr:hypothetical protein [Acidobacteriota bacterium]